MSESSGDLVAITPTTSLDVPSLSSSSGIPSSSRETSTISSSTTRSPPSTSRTPRPPPSSSRSSDTPINSSTTASLVNPFPTSSDTSSIGSPTTSQPPTRSTSTKTVTSNGSRTTVVDVTVVTPSSSAAPTESASPGLVPGNQDDAGGLSKGAIIAIAVVVPLVVLALLAFLLIWCWRRRKQKKEEEEIRRKEVEEYGYNPNNDPTLPAVFGAGGTDSPDVTSDGGYRGWSNNIGSDGAPMSNGRKASTNLSNGGIGMAYSDEPTLAGSRSPNSGEMIPPDSSHGPFGDSGAAHASGAAAAIGVAGMAHRGSRGGNGNTGNGAALQRGASNASSTYSAAGRTDASGDMLGGVQDEYNYSSYSSGYPSGGGMGGDGAQPVIRDVSARRNTKIENAVYPQQGNTGISQNF